MWNKGAEHFVLVVRFHDFAWAHGLAFLAAGFAVRRSSIRSHFATFDFLTSLGIHAPRVSGAAAGLLRDKVSLFITFGPPATNANEAYAVVFEQFVQAFSALRFSSSWCYFGTLDFGAILGVDAPRIASRTVHLDYFEVTERSALRDV